MGPGSGTGGGAGGSGGSSPGGNGTPPGGRHIGVAANQAFTTRQWTSGLNPVKTSR